MRHVTRIAPSPTGPTHMGTVRTAYFNWLAAKATHGKFIVRIDDTDRLRSDQFYADQFLTVLRWLGLRWNALHYQSARQSVYRKYAARLIDQGLAIQDGKAVRLNLTSVPDVKTWRDELAGDIKITKSNTEGFDKMYLIKSDGSPTYHFASCVDDIDMGITMVIRGKDHTTNTSKHTLLYHLLGADSPQYYHIGLLNVKDPDTGKVKKLSKRDAASDITAFMAQEIDPDAMLNFLARLGWGPSKDDKSTAILTRDDMKKLFFVGGKMKNKDATIDLQKLDSFDRKYKGRKKAAGEDQ